MMPSSLERKWPHHQSAQVPPSKMSGTDKLTGFLSWNIAEERRNTVLRARVSTTLQGHQSARFQSDHLCCVRVYGPSQFLEII